jgi:hypothetical protein
VSSPPNDEFPQVIFSLARQRLLKFGPDGAKGLFRQYRPTSEVAARLIEVRLAGAERTAFAHVEFFAFWSHSRSPEEPGALGLVWCKVGRQRN